MSGDGSTFFRTRFRREQGSADLDSQLLRLIIELAAGVQMIVGGNSQ